MSDQIQAAIDALIMGIENTTELAMRHELKLGRSTRPNLARANYFISEIKKMESALEGLKKIEVTK